MSRTHYLLQETLRGARRGGWMNWAAISTITVLLLLFGLSLQANWQLERLTRQFGNQLEVSAFLSPGVAAESVLPFVTKFRYIKTIEPISKDLAWQELSQDLEFPDLETITEQLNGNPLVDELRILVDAPEHVAGLVQQLQQLQGIESVQYMADVVERLGHLNAGLHTLGLVLVGLLTLATLAVITTTIRLIVVAQRREIEILQLVGATKTWICLPFVLHGLGFGAIGGGFAWLILLGLQSSLQQVLMQQADFIQFLAQGLALGWTEWLILPSILVVFGGSESED
ncbi:MAG: permease-like cell division protein FtsX [Cyanobacteria bacterium P01_H01_bin.121]